MKPCKLLFLVVLLIYVSQAITNEGQPDPLANLPFKPNQSEIPAEEDDILFPEKGKFSRMLSAQKSNSAEISASIMSLSGTALLSNNEKIVFLALQNGPLQIIDVSNQKSPSILTSIEFTNSGKRGMAVSPDDKRLYAVGNSSLEIIDVSNPSKPKLLGKLSLNRSATSKASPTIAISSDEKIAYVGYLSLEVYNISDPASIKLLYSGENQGTTTVHLMKNGKTLLVGSKNLQVYDVSAPESPVQISMFNTQWQLRSLAVSSDETTLYLAYAIETLSTGKRKGRIEILDITNIKDPKSKKIIEYSVENTDRPFLILSRRESYLFLLGDNALRALNLRNFEISEIQAEAINQPVSFCLSADGRVAYVVAMGQFVVLQLLLDIELSNVFSLEKAFVAQFPINDSASRMVLSPNGKILYVTNLTTRSLMSYDISNYNNPRLIQKSDVASFDTFLISNDGTLLFSYYSQILVIYNSTDLSLLQGFTRDNESALDVSSDSTKVFVASPLEDRRTLLTIYDISTPDQKKTISSSKVAVDPHLIFKVSKDCKTVFFMSHLKNMSIIDISDPANPILLSSLFALHYFTHLVFSPINDSIAFVVSSFQLIEYFTIVDLSNLKAPKILSSILLPYTERVKPLLYVSEDSKTVFLSQEPGVTIIDVSVLSNPAIISTINDENIQSFTISKNGAFLFLGLNSQEILILDRFPRQATSFPTKPFGLGHSHSQHFSILKLNEKRRYDPFPEEYKFADVSLSVIKVNSFKNLPEISFSPLPNWMHFDQATGVFGLEPKSYGNIGAYNLHVVVSTEIPSKAFMGVANIEEEKDSRDLIASLIGLGYLDNERFLTSSFSPSKKLFLTSNYSDYETAIRDVLAKNYFPLSILFRVESSLHLSKIEGGGFVINSAFTPLVTVQIIISKNETSKNADAQFLSLTFAGVLVTNTNHKTRLTLDGSLDDINNALQELTINLKEDDSYCNGSITIMDGSNPKISEDIFNISSYFRANKPPTENKNNSIQSQVNRVPVLLGEYFHIEFSASSFSDENPEFLKYSLSMPDKSTKLPSWIALKDNKMTGTPPEEITLSSIDLVLIASNEFKSVEVPFRINIKTSFIFVFKLLFKYTTFTLSFIGIYIIFFKLYNLLGLKFYRHPKNFLLLTGKELSANSIYPISFVAEEIRISQYLERKIREQVAKELEIKKLTDSQFVQYFINPDENFLDKTKLNQSINSVIQDLDLSKHPKLKHYASRIKSSNKLICDLIYSGMVSRQLSLPKEQKTKRLFNSIKGDWIQFVEFTKSSQFVIKEDRIQAKLDSLSPEKELKDTLLEEVFNVNLLKQALINHAFQYHNLNYYIHDIDIHVREKVQRESFLHNIRRVFKADHKSIPSNDKGKVGYGIEYKIKQNTLSFSGVPEDKFAERTLFVQIMTTKKRIIRELCLLGCDSDSILGSAEESIQETPISL